MFDDSDNTDDAFDDEDIEVLSTDNSTELLSPQVKLYRFPHVEGERRTGVFVRHVTLSVASKYQQATQGASLKAQLRATCDLVANSVVDRDGNPVWTSGQMENLANSRVDRFLFMQQCVSKHNDLSADPEKMKELIEAAGKN